MGERMRTLGNEFGATTGRARRCGWFDAVVVRYATRINGLTDIAVTKLDVLDTLDRVAICTGYEYDGDVHTEFPGDITSLDQVVPRYEWMEGWQQLDGATRARSRSCRRRRARYLDRMRELIETPITYVSVGTRRDQIIGLSDGIDRMTRGRVDLSIVGGGPCGLAAAISAQRAGLSRSCSRARRS